jgi:hypothetical protein
MRAFDRELNRVILELAPRHVARAYSLNADANTAPEALAQMFTGDGFLVFDGGSDATIYADPRVNFAFRAWHDMHHIKAARGFTLPAERDVCESQLRELVAAYPRAPRAWLDLIRAEIIGQAEHFARFGEFPIDQAAFIRDYIAARAKP